MPDADYVKSLAHAASEIHGREVNAAVVLRCDWHHCTLWFADVSPLPSKCPQQITADGVLCLLPLTPTAAALVVPDGR